jgi:hypothetical protein
MSTKSTSHERTSRNFHNDVLKKESIDKAHADKNNTVKEEREKKDYMICKYTSNSYTTLHEAILIGNIPYFLTLKGDEISIVEKIELDDMNLIPHNRTNYLSKEYSFSSAEEILNYQNRAKKENLDSLYQKVKNIWKKYLDIDENSIILCAADTIFTYFQDRLGITHYLLFVGDNNSGKSNALRIFESMGYRPMFDTSITPANIYNFLDKIEEGQGIILEDEIDNIEEQQEKMKIYKGGYVSGTKVTRIYDLSNGNNSSKRQQRYFTFSFKAFSSEKYPAFFKAKGFNERILTVNCSPGTPQYDITEVFNDAGDPKYKKLHNELEDLRKLLLMYRVLNYDKSIPDIELSLRNRDKQLCKPLLRLFQNTICIKEITKSLSKFISEKKNKKLNSLDYYLYSIIIDLTKNGTCSISNEILWNMILQLSGDPVPYKPHSYQTEEFGLVSKYQITRICEDKFGAHRGHDGKQRTLVFDPNTLRNLESNYSPIEEIKILSNVRTNTSNTFNTFWKSIEQNYISSSKSQVSILAQNSQDIKNNEGNSKENDYKIRKTSNQSVEKYPAVPPRMLDVLNVLERQSQVEKRINELGLFRKWDRSDTWACQHCNDSGDKWYMLKHPCKGNRQNAISL